MQQHRGYSSRHATSVLMSAVIYQYGGSISQHIDASWRAMRHRTATIIRVSQTRTLTFCVWPLDSGHDVMVHTYAGGMYWHGTRFAYGYSTQLIVDTCTDNDLQHKVPVLPCITNLWNNKEYAWRHINERCRMQGTPRVPLVTRARFGVIDRRANFILGALDASSFLFPIGQRRPRGELWSTWMYLFNLIKTDTHHKVMSVPRQSVATMNRFHCHPLFFWCYTSGLLISTKHLLALSHSSSKYCRSNCIMKTRHRFTFRWFWFSSSHHKQYVATFIYLSLLCKIYLYLNLTYDICTHV